MCRWHCVWTWRRWVGVFPSPWCWMVFRVGWLDMEGLEWADRQPSIECSVASGGSGLVSYVNRRGSWIWEVKGVNFKVLVGIPCSGFGKSIWRLCEKHLINLFKSFCSKWKTKFTKKITSVGLQTRRCKTCPPHPNHSLLKNNKRFSRKRQYLQSSKTSTIYIDGPQNHQANPTKAALKVLTIWK